MDMPIGDIEIELDSAESINRTDLLADSERAESTLFDGQLDAMHASSHGDCVPAGFGR
jgi:hypothetical protein